MPLEGMDSNGDDESHFGFNGIASQSFGDCLAKTITDTENSTLPSTRRWVWNCKPSHMLKVPVRLVLQKQFLASLVLYKTLLHRKDASTRTQGGERQLEGSWGEGSASDLSEPKERPPEAGGDEGKERMERLHAREASRSATVDVQL
jgi:hypothetical protein